MICRKCGSETHCIDSRDSKGNSIRRRRECVSCGYRFTTYEISDVALAELKRAERVRDRLIKKIEDYEKENLR